MNKSINCIVSVINQQHFYSYLLKTHPSRISTSNRYPIFKILSITRRIKLSNNTIWNITADGDIFHFSWLNWHTQIWIQSLIVSIQEIYSLSYVSRICISSPPSADFKSIITRSWARSKRNWQILLTHLGPFTTSVNTFGTHLKLMWTHLGPF